MPLPQPQAVPPPSVIVQPQITVAPARPPAITIQTPPGLAPIVVVPPQAFWKTLLPVFVAMLSAAIAAFSAFIAHRAQRFGFRKDAAAVAREIRARRTTAAMQAFENNVARPMGMVLDLLERLVGEILRTVPVDAAVLRAETENRGAMLVAEYASALRLCAEADGGLPGPDRRPFQLTLAPSDLDGKLNAALVEALGRTALNRAAYALLLTALADFKVAMRRLLENERIAEQRRWMGTLRQDPFYPELVRLLGQADIDLLLGVEAGREPPGLPPGDAAITGTAG